MNFSIEQIFWLSWSWFH